MCFFYSFFFFFFNDTATTEIYTLSLHDALPIWSCPSPSIASISRCPPPGETGRSGLLHKGRASPTETGIAGFTEASLLGWHYVAATDPSPAPPPLAKPVPGA